MLISLSLTTCWPSKGHKEILFSCQVFCPSGIVCSHRWELPHFFEIYLNIPINCYGPKSKKKTLTHQHLPIETIWWLVGRSFGRSTTLVVLCQLNRMEEVGSWLWLIAMYHITSQYEKGLIPFVMGHDEQARNSLVMRVHTYPFSFRRFTHLLLNSMEKYWKCSSPPIPPKKKQVV